MTTATAVEAVADQVTRVAEDLRAANVANQANAVTAIYGISGSGKSSLADTAAEYCAETFGRTTLCYAADLGGWGNKRLSLMRNGVMRVYDPRNHVNPFETMELISLGAWPEAMIDPERGYADPHVRLILPRRIVYLAQCPNGHEAARYESEATMVASAAPCPQCGVLVTVANQQTEKVIVRHRLFRTVGMRIYDSLTALNDWGLLVLPEMSAKGKLPAGREGGSALGSADAIREGSTVFGTGSKAQVGFMQNRSYGWLSNIRTIPDQVVPAVVTFGVEQSKADDETGGLVVLGPQIAGNARTSKVPGWVGNCLHASKEPNADGQMVHRLWLTNHIDPNDARRIPYLAKHRGEPLGMPEFLEDPYDADPATRAELAWSRCSLRVFFQLLDDQLTVLELRDKERFGKIAALRQDDAASEEDEVIGAVGDAATGTAPVPVTGGRTIGRRVRRGGAGTAPVAPAVAPTPVTATTVPSPTASVGAAPGGSGPATPSAIARQLTDTLAAAQAASVETAGGTARPASAQEPPTGTVSPAAATPTAPSRLRRVPRPPVQ